MDLRNIVERLKVKFGLGDDPEKSRRLYAGIERLCTDDGPDAERAYRIVGDVAQEADRARNRGKWFRKAVVCRLHEAGLWGRRGAVPTH